MDGDRRLVQTLLERLSARLPFRTGDDLSDVRRDEVVALARGSLIELARAQIDIVVDSIAKHLESISRGFGDLAPRSRPLVLLTQTYLVEVLADCTGAHWDSIDAAHRGMVGERASVAEPLRKPGVSTRKSRRREREPPPLDDIQAKYVLELLLRLTATPLMDDGHGPSVGRKENNNNSQSEERSLDGLPKKASDLERASFKVIEYLSASNWALVFHTMSQRLKFLRTTASDDSDASGLQFIAHMWINQEKLSLIIKEISGSFLPLRKPAQNMLAALLPETIHRWIEAHPNDFVDLHVNNRRLEKGVDILFDIATSLADGAKRRAIIWPLQTALILLLPDVFWTLELRSEQRGSLSKKVAFLNDLRRSLRLPRSSDIAASCLIIMCRAGSLFPAESESALLGFALDVQNEVTEEIFRRQQFGEDLSVDTDIMIKAFVSSAKLGVDSVVENLLPRCLDKNSPITFKITVFAGVAVLASQNNAESYDALYHAIAPEARELFINIASTRHANSSSTNGTSLAGSTLNSQTRHKNLSTDSIGSSELLYQLLELLKMRPLLMYENLNAGAEEWDRLGDRMISSLLRLIYDDDEFVRNSAVVFARRLLSPEAFQMTTNMRLGEGAISVLNFFWKATSAIVATLSKKLLDFDFRDPGLKSMLELVHGYLETRVSIISSRKDITEGITDIPERTIANVSLEVSFLVLLCSSDLDICSITTHAIALLCEEGRLTENPDDLARSNLTVMRNFPVYSELSLQTFRITGPVAFQKRLRKLLTRMSMPGPGILTAWEAVFTRWRTLSKHILSPGVASAGGIDDRLFAEWRNYSGFLASIAGCCIADLPHGPHQLRTDDSTPLGLRWIDRLASDGDQMSLLERFMKQCLQLLVCKLVNVRENIREVLGTELNPRLYLQLFRSLETEFSILFDPGFKDTLSESRTLFAEQACSLLKTIVERLEDAQDMFLTVDLGALTLSLARYLNTLKEDYTTLRVKIRMCQLVELVARKKELVNLRQDIRVRNNLLQILSEWMPRPAKETNYPINPRKDELIRPQRDLDRACLKALVNLLHRLPLQPPETAHDSADVVDARSQMFCSYFTLFLSLLDSSQLESDRRRELQTVSLAKDDASSFQDLAIQALSNLLSANVDVGLKFSLEIGYHDDIQTRTAFMHVLTNILTQGTEFGALGDSAIGEKYEKLIDLLVNDLQFALALCDSCPSSEVDEMSIALLNIFDSRGLGLTLLKELIEQEVANTESESELLRRNCVATKMLSVFAKWKGSEYLRNVLQKVLQRVIVSSDKLGLELDPARTPSTEELHRNELQLRYITKVFIDEICKSGNIVPNSFRWICHTITTCVTSRFPEAKFTAVGAFIFLRFFCPAIVAPDSEGLVNNIPNKEMRRGLLLIAKIVQNLANNVLFGAKEPYMIPLNDFLTANICVVTAFLREISSLPKKQEPVLAQESFDFGSSVALHRFLYDHWETVRQKLIFQEKHKARLNGEKNFSADGGPSNLQLSITKFSALIGTLGAPPLDISLGRPTLTGNIQPAYSRYQHFMLRNSGRSVESILAARIVYDGGETKDNMPVICFVLRNINIGTVDPDLLIYCYLKIASRMWHKPFAVLIDATCYSLNNEMPDELYKKIDSLMPPDMVKNYSRLYIYNMNTAYRKFFRRQLRYAVRDENNAWNPNNIDFIMLGSLAELQQHFNLGSLHLPKETMSFLSDPRYMYHHITRLSKTKGKIEVVFKIGTQYIQITPTKKQEIVAGLKMSATINDIFRLNDVEEANASFHTDEENAFGIKTDNGKLTMFFSSPKKNEIVQTLKNSKSKYSKDNRPSKLNERTIRPEDVPGTLLNISLMNIASYDQYLRLAAYNLLCALCQAFRFNLDRQFVSAKGLSIPTDSVTLIVGVSEKLAAAEPQLTFDFLSEFFVGWEKSHPQQRPLNILYMAPWLANLHSQVLMGEDAERGKERLATIARKMIDITVREPRLYTSFQQNAWCVISKDEGLLDVFLDELIKSAMNFGFGSEGAETIGSIASSFGTLTIRGKIIARIRKVLNRSSLRPMRHLVDNIVWNEICVLLRLCLAISFDSRIQAQMYLPELFHIITMVVNCGSILVRSTVHSLLVNTVHSICVSFPLEEAKLTQLKGILTSLSEPKLCLLFSLNRPTSRDALAIQEQRGSETTTATSMELITNLLLEIVSVAAPSTDMANIWRARWMSLVASTAFQSNPAIQSRAFAVMGCLAREDVDDDLLYQVLVALRGALSRYSETGDHEMLTSIVTSLTKMMENLQPTSRYLYQLFWLAMSLVRVGHGQVFTCSAGLLEATLKTIASSGEFKDNRMVPVLLQGRNQLEEATAAIDDIYNIKFNSESFHFAVCATLTKGLQDPSTKPSALRTLTAFLEVISANTPENSHWGTDVPVPPYLSMVLTRTTSISETKEVLWIIGIALSEEDPTTLDTDTTSNNPSPSPGIIPGTSAGGDMCAKLTPLMDTMSEQNLLLIGALAVIDLRSCEESIQKYALALFTRMGERRPEVLLLLYDHLLEYLDEVLNSSHNPMLLKEANALMCVVSLDARFANRGAQAKEALAFKLRACGLAGIWAATSFRGTKELEKRCAGLTDRLIEVCIS